MHLFVYVYFTFLLKRITFPFSWSVNIKKISSADSALLIVIFPFCYLTNGENSTKKTVFLRTRFDNRPSTCNIYFSKCNIYFFEPKIHSDSTMHYNDYFSIKMSDMWFHLVHVNICNRKVLNPGNVEALKNQTMTLNSENGGLLRSARTSRELSIIVWIGENPL